MRFRDYLLWVVMFLGICAVAVCLNSCSHYDKANKTMWGIGAYKDCDVEQSAEAPKFSLM